MTQEEAARSLDVSRPTFVQIEAGRRSVSSIELQKLAFLFGRDIREFLAETFEPEDTLAALFRADGDGDHPDVKNKLRECLAIGRELTNLEQLVGIDRDLTGLVSYDIPAPNTRWTAVDQGNRLAEDERRRLGLGTAPVPNLAGLLESIGVRTASIELPEDISGLTLHARDVGVFVVTNRRHPAIRRRFSLAHEYAHVLLDRAQKGLISRHSDHSELIEVRANAFAATFLMPEQGVVDFIGGVGKGKPSRNYAEVYDESGSISVEGRTEPGSQSIQSYDVVRLAHRFEVSVPSALYRLRNLKLVSGPEFEFLKELEQSGKARRLAKALGVSEQDRGEHEFEPHFLALALEALRRELISRGKLRDLLRLIGRAPREIDQLITDAGLE